MKADLFSLVFGGQWLVTVMMSVDDSWVRNRNFEDQRLRLNIHFRQTDMIGIRNFHKKKLHVRRLNTEQRAPVNKGF